MQRQITFTKVRIVLDIMRKLNAMIVLLYIPSSHTNMQGNLAVKTSINIVKLNFPTHYVLTSSVSNNSQVPTIGN